VHRCCAYRSRGTGQLAARRAHPGAAPADPTPSGEGALDAFHPYGRAKRLRRKPLSDFAGDHFLRVLAAEREQLVTVRLEVRRPGATQRGTGAAGRRVPGRQSQRSSGRTACSRARCGALDCVLCHGVDSAAKACGVLHGYQASDSPHHGSNLLRELERKRDEQDVTAQAVPELVI